MPSFPAPFATATVTAAVTQGLAALHTDDLGPTSQQNLTTPDLYVASPTTPPPPACASVAPSSPSTVAGNDAQPNVAHAPPVDDLGLAFEQSLTMSNHPHGKPAGHRPASPPNAHVAAAPLLSAPTKSSNRRSKKRRNKKNRFAAEADALATMRAEPAGPRILVGPDGPYLDHPPLPSASTIHDIYQDDVTLLLLDAGFPEDQIDTSIPVDFFLFVGVQLFLIAWSAITMHGGPAHVVQFLMSSLRRLIRRHVRTYLASPRVWDEDLSELIHNHFMTIDWDNKEFNCLYHRAYPWEGTSWAKDQRHFSVATLRLGTDVSDRATYQHASGSPFTPLDIHRLARDWFWSPAPMVDPMILGPMDETTPEDHTDLYNSDLDRDEDYGDVYELDNFGDVDLDPFGHLDP